MRKGLMKYPLTTAAFALAGGLALSTAQAAPIPLGYISYDVNIPGSFAQFDIVNETGPNSTFPPDPTFPVTTTAQFTLSSLSLVVDFSDGSSKTFGPYYFTLGSDGESLDGSPIAIGGTTPNPVSAVLTGMLSPAPFRPSTSRAAARRPRSARRTSSTRAQETRRQGRSCVPRTTPMST